MSAITAGVARRFAQRLREGGLWALSTRARGFILVVETAYLLAVVAGFAVTPPGGSDILTFGVLVACGMLSIEGSVRLVWRRATASRSNDMMGVWTLPAALLLPPALAALVVLPLDIFFFHRVARKAPYKAAFNTACIGLSCFIGSSVHQMLVDGSAQSGVGRIVGSGSAVLATLACAVVRQAVNDLLVAQVIVATRPNTRLRDCFNDREAWGIVGAETSTGLLVAIACAASAYSVLLAIPPALVLQRTLLLTEFREAARTDPKTGLANSSYWREVAERELARARGGREPLAVLLVDIDHFKDVNDRYGHLVGDDVLRAVSNGLTHGLRPRDFVGRFGGEEFVVLLTGSDLEQAKHAAERIRSHVADLSVEASNRREPVQVTISIGVAAFRDSGHSVHELLDAADAALYAAKHAGRNCVRVAEGARQQVLDLTSDAGRVIDLRSQRTPID